MTEVALIPPIAMMGYNRPQKYQLMLPHLLTEGRYRRAYARYCEDDKKYVILDNGAAERVVTSNNDLIKIALTYGVQEVVAPDVLANKNETIVATSRFLEAIGDVFLVEKIKVGIVAQGTSVQEALACVHRILTSYAGHRVNVVYLPRLLVNSIHPEARIVLASEVHHHWPELEIHFLGASRAWLQEPLAMHEKTPFVRSIDTSVPFTEAYHRRLLTQGQTVGEPRPEHYFGWDTSDDNKLEIVRKNVGRYLGWMKGVSIPKHNAKTAP